MEKIEIKEIKEINVEAIKELNTTITRRKAVLTRARIKQIENAIPTTYEEMKRDERLRPTIREMDFQTLKMIDAVMRHHNDVSKHVQNSSLNIKPGQLSERAVNLYVALVRGIYEKIVSTHSSTYTMEELQTIGTSLQGFNLKLTEYTDNKDKKFYAAEETIGLLKEVNKGVVARLTGQIESTKTLSK